MSDIFQHLLVLGRPACGKSEFIDFLKHAARRHAAARGCTSAASKKWTTSPGSGRSSRTTRSGRRPATSASTPRSTCPATRAWRPKGAKLFDWCMHKFNEVIARAVPRAATEFYRDAHAAHRVLARRRERVRPGARHARPAPSSAPAAIFYIKVSREESWRRNVARYQEKLKHSILAHMVPRETYDHFYDVNDWDELTGGRPSGWLDVNGVRVPVRLDEQRAGVDRPGGARGALRGGARRALGARGASR